MAPPPPVPAFRLPDGLCAEDEEEEELLAALEESLEELGGEEEEPPEAPPGPAGTALAADATLAGGFGPKSLGHGLVCWPVEVRIGVAAFLPWQELVRDARVCRVWRSLELEDVLWQVYFQTAWPRWSRRREAREDGGLPWRTLFRTRWAKASRTEDALEEDWLDFSAAQDLHQGGSAAAVSRDRAPVGPAAAAAVAPGPTAAELQRAVRRCREDLRRAGRAAVPSEVIQGHVCSRKCRFHRVAVDGDTFLCEASGALHRCRDGQPCDLCINDDDSSFLVCPVSGRCFGYLTAHSAEGEQGGGDAAAGPPTWDPELSMSEQYGHWFEQGYFMSEDQAKALFGHGDGRRAKRPSCRT